MFMPRIEFRILIEQAYHACELMTRKVYVLAIEHHKLSSCRNHQVALDPEVHD
jgi:hypothetical protein